jgi:hypothetical protein
MTIASFPKEHIKSPAPPVTVTGIAIERRTAQAVFDKSLQTKAAAQVGHTSRQEDLGPATSDREHGPERLQAVEHLG